MICTNDLGVPTSQPHKHTPKEVPGQPNTRFEWGLLPLPGTGAGTLWW